MDSQKIVFNDDEEVVTQEFEGKPIPGVNWDRRRWEVLAEYDECGIVCSDDEQTKSEKFRARMAQPNPPEHDDILFPIAGVIHAN